MEKVEINDRLLYYLFTDLMHDAQGHSYIIGNLGYRIMQVGNSGFKRESVIQHFKLLVSKNLIAKISENPDVYQFTEKAKGITSQEDLVCVITNVA